MKKTLLFLLLVTINTYAQTNQNEAIAAYQLAEESYEKGDYKTTLRFLESAKKKLGTSNCKLLYLQIQAETELFKTRPDGSAEIHQQILVSRDNQRAIVLGKGGSRIKEIGSRARAEIMPAVTVPPKPKGLPMASTQSPTRALSESPNET